MNRFDTTRIIRTAILGAVAGFLNFLIQEPMARRSEIAQAHDLASEALPVAAFQESMLMFSMLGLLVAGALVIADEFGSMSAKRTLTRFAIGLVAGAGCGALAGLVGQGLFSLILGQGVPDISVLIFARALGWASVGAGTGLAAGLPSASLRKCLQGIIGGIIGGAIGGIVFDLASVPFRGGTAGRLIGDTAIGMCVGAAVMLVEEAAKVAWVTVVLGRNEGKQFILSKSSTTIGRDELSDVPLYGDMNVAKQHGTISTQDGRLFSYHDMGSPGGSGINGFRVTEKPLADGDCIQIGSFQLLFSHKSGGSMIPEPMYTQPPAQPYQTQNPATCPFCGQYRDPSTGLCACSPGGQAVTVQTAVALALTGVAGPYAGVTFQLNAGRLEIGRDPSNNIVLDQDSGISRKHAMITKQGEGFFVQDLGSTNGVYVNGNRIPSAPLNPGDLLHLGCSTFRVQ